MLTNHVTLANLSDWIKNILHCSMLCESMVLSLQQYICTQPLHSCTELAEYVMNKCITQAGEGQPVKYNFDILEDQIPHEHHNHYTLVWMVSSVWCQLSNATCTCFHISVQKWHKNLVLAPNDRVEVIRITPFSWVIAHMHVWATLLLYHIIVPIIEHRYQLSTAHTFFYY